MKSKSREEDDSDDDEEVQDKIKDRIIKDTVEGLYVINKMLLSDSEDCKKLMRDARVDSNIQKEFQNVVKGRTKKSSQPSSSDDDDDDKDNGNGNGDDSGDDNDNCDDSDDDRSNSDVDQSRATATARITNSKEISSHVRSNKSSLSSTTIKGSVLEAMKEDKYKPLIKIMERNKTGIATGEEPIYYNSDGEEMGANPGPSVRNQWGNRVSSRHLKRNDGDDSDLPHLSSKGGDHDNDRDTPRSVLKKRKGSAAVNDDLKAPRKHGVPSRSIKCATDQKEESKIDRTGAMDDANPLFPPCDFTTATLVMREILSRRMRQHSDALIDFIPTLGDKRKRVTRGSLLPVTIVTQCGGCGCTGTYFQRHLCCFSLIILMHTLKVLDWLQS